ncbi:MAG: hypothetical protein Q9195_000813 [Heterodermia aff. obscurata]
MSLPVQIAQALGITGSAFLAGGILSVSAFAIPAIQLAPEALAARQWKKLYYRGKNSAPYVATTAALALGALSYQFYGTLNQPSAELYGLSALLIILNPPYTWIFVDGINNILWARADASSASKKDDEVEPAAVSGGQSTKELLDLWAIHNVIRGLLPLAGSIIAFWTTFN